MAQYCSKYNVGFSGWIQLTILDWFNVEFLKCSQTVEHLSWLGLFKEMPDVPQKLSPFYHKRTLRKPQGECELVREKFLQMKSVHPNNLEEHLV